MFCSQCGAYLPDDSNFCGQCGKAVFITKKKCPKCRNEYKISMIFCDNCGTLLETSRTTDQIPSSIFTANHISLFEERSSTVLPKITGQLSFFNQKITFTPVKGKQRKDPESIELWYNDISTCETDRRYKLPGITIQMKNGARYSFIGSFSQPNFDTDAIQKMILHHID